MAKKKKGGKKKRGDSDSDDDDDQGDTIQTSPPNTANESTTKKLSRKEKRQQKQSQKAAQHQQQDKEDDGDALAALIGGGGGAPFDSSDDDDDDDSDGMPPPKPSNKNKNKKKQPPPKPQTNDNDGDALAALILAGGGASDDSDDDDNDDDDDDELEDQAAAPPTRNDEDDEDEQEQQQIATAIADDWDIGGDDDDKKKKKKHKKEKKEKKQKKEKKSKKEKKVQPEQQEEEEETPPKKSKFELQMEAAMNKKEQQQQQQQEDDNENDEITRKPSTQQQPALSKEQQQEPDWVDTQSKPPNNDNTNATLDTETIMYGAPDDHAWTDQSTAQKDMPDTIDNDTTKSPLLYGPDGKKLSNKERKKLLKAQQAAERAAQYEQTAALLSRQGAQFACSQTAVSENDPTWENSLDINIPSFTISAAGKTLFQNATLTITHGRRYGLIAPNGRGKSTLLKMIASRDLRLPPRIDFLYVEQEVVADGTPAVEAVLKADTVRWELLQEEAALLQTIEEGAGGEDDDTTDTTTMETIQRLQTVSDQLTNMGADAAESKARRILYGLGFSMEMQTKPTKMFSGGWRMRISLARALFVEPTLLMLDEPTNHLDLNAVIWLDEYLQKWKKTLLIVSHDQDFLNSVCQEILHIEDLKLCSYKGNYDSFKKAEHQKFLQQTKAWEKQEKRLKELKRSGKSKAQAQEAVKRSATKREAGARNQKKKNQAVAAGTEAAEVTELIKRPKEYSVKLEFVEVAELSRPVMEVNNVHFRYSPKHPVIFDCVDFGIDMDSRICIVGPNGAGKSTLLKLLTGELEPTKGECKRNPRLRMGIYNQHFVERLPMGKTPVEHLRDRFQNEDYQSIRNRLGRYGLEGHAHEVAMRDLSGGQKARVVFVELSLQEPHILLLDEPTNNLDIETIDALCDAINEFNGGIVIVTHDQRLIDECDCTLWVVEKRGVTRWEAGFDDYRDTILKELEDAVEKEAAVRREKLEAAAKAKAEKIARLAKIAKKK